jgi:hypothetical protein
MTTPDKPGNYDRVMTWLAENSPATIDGTGRVLGLTRSRVLLIFRSARLNGDVRCEPFSHSQRYPLQWWRS